MNKFLEFLQKKRYVIIWTVCYVVAMWAILQFMFNFNMFSAAQWNVLMHAQLRGFAGFVFGLLILAAVPLYVATTAIIIRTGKPLIPVKIPKFMTPVPIQEDNKKEDVPQTTPQVEETDKKIVPTELKAAFERARVHVGAAPKSVFDIGNVITNRPQANETQSVPELQPSDALPLPNDFDVSVDEVPSFTPVFSDMDFEVEDTDGGIGSLMKSNGLVLLSTFKSKDGKTSGTIGTYYDKERGEFAVLVGFKPYGE